MTNKVLFNQYQQVGMDQVFVEHKISEFQSGSQCAQQSPLVVRSEYFPLNITPKLISLTFTFCYRVQLSGLCVLFSFPPSRLIYLLNHGRINFYVYSVCVSYLENKTFVLFDAWFYRQLSQTEI